jgi:site-specific recombinase XerD
MKGCRPLTDPEVAQVLAELARGHAPVRDQAFFLLGHRSGFRVSELLSLAVGDVFQNGNFVDRVCVARCHMKGKKEGRTVLLHPEAKAAIARLVQELQHGGQESPDTFLFQSREGANQAMNRRSAWSMMQRVYTACGLTGKLGTHCMRKTFAKRIYEKLGHDLMKTQKALGHARVTSTTSYLSFAEEEIDDAILKA